MHPTTTLVVLLGVLGYSLPTREATDKYYWSWSHDNIIECPDPVKAGITFNGTVAYVSRAHKGKDVFPGFADIEEINATVFLNLTYNGKSSIYEVLCGSGVAWQYYNAQANQTFPENAIPAGEQNGQPLYVCRAPLEGYHGNYVSGHIEPKYNVCNLPTSFNDLEYSLNTFAYQYEVLIEVPTSKKEENQDFHWDWTSISYEPCKDRIKAGLGSSAYVAHKYVMHPARSHHYEALIPGLSSSSTNYYTSEGKVYNTTVYEVLCGTNIAWQPIDTLTDEIPESAINVGYSGNDTLYACKLLIPGLYGSVSLGYVDLKNQSCIAASQNSNWIFREVSSSNSFEIMIYP